MKKLIIAGIGIIVCVALCAVVWPRNAGVGDLPAEPIKSAVSAEIKDRSEEKPQIYFSANSFIAEVEIVSESEAPKTDITAEKETRYNKSNQPHRPPNRTMEMFVS